MNSTKRLSVAAVMAVLALLGAAMFGGAADAKKKKGGSKTVTAKGKVGLITDATETALDFDADGFDEGTGNGGEFARGVTVLTAKVPKSADGKVTDVKANVAITHADVGDLTIWIQSPGGKIVELWNGGENFPASMVFAPTDPFKSAGKFGPATFSDAATLRIDDTNGCPGASELPAACAPADPTRPDGGGVEALAPYAGIFKPEAGLIASLGGKWQPGAIMRLIIRDFDAPGECRPPATAEGCAAGDPADTGKVDSWSVSGKLKGGGGGKKK